MIFWIRVVVGNCINIFYFWLDSLFAIQFGRFICAFQKNQSYAALGYHWCFRVWGYLDIPGQEFSGVCCLEL